MPVALDQRRIEAICTTCEDDQPQGSAAVLLGALLNVVKVAVISGGASIAFRDTADAVYQNLQDP